MTRLLVLLITWVVLLSGCMRRLVGNGNYIDESRSLNPFTAVETDGAFNVELTNATEAAIQVHAESNILPEIVTEVHDGVLIIGYKSDMTNIKHGEISITVPSHNLRSVTLAGSGSIISTDTLRADHIDISLLGSGKIHLLTAGNSIKTLLSGSGDVQLAGRVNSQKMVISGSGNVHAYDLTSDVVQIEISGSGNAELDVTKTIDAVIKGSGDVRYEGNATATSNITGSGTVQPR